MLSGQTRRAFGRFHRTHKSLSTYTSQPVYFPLNTFSRMSTTDAHNPEEAATARLNTLNIKSTVSPTNDTLRPSETTRYPYSHSDILLEDVYNVLSHQAPGFPIPQHLVSIIPTPHEFYSSIIRNIEHANHRIVLSALYIGTGEQEQAIFTALANALRSKPALHVHLMFDASRGCRIEKTGKSSLDMCAGLMREFGTRVTTAMVKAPVVEKHLDGPEPPTPTLDYPDIPGASHTPAPSRVSALGPEFWSPISSALSTTHTLLDSVQRRFTGRLSELCAVHHSKLYLCDDTVILTGANASQVYFEQRQDRYVAVKDAALCDWLVAYSQAMALTPYATLYSGLTAYESELRLFRADLAESSTADIPITALQAPPGFFPSHWLADQHWSPAARAGAAVTSVTPSASYPDQFRTRLETLLMRQQTLMLIHCNGARANAAVGVESGRERFLASLVALRSLFDTAALARAAPADNAAATTVDTVAPAVAAAPALDSLPALNSVPALDAGHVLLFPLMEWRAIGVTHDSRAFHALLRAFTQRIQQSLRNPRENPENRENSGQTESVTGMNMVIETGYFNPPQRLLKLFASLLAQGDSRINVVTGGVGSNGWSDAKGATAQIPVLYNTIIQRARTYTNELVAKERKNQPGNTPSGNSVSRSPFSVWEYVRPNWSYHAKGLWAQYTHARAAGDTSRTTAATPDNAPGSIASPAPAAATLPAGLRGCSIDPSRGALTIVGSSNYGVRSYFRDNELQFYMLVPGAAPAAVTPAAAAVTPADPLAETYAVLTDTALPLAQRMDAELKLSFAFAQNAEDPAQVKWYLKPFVSLIGRFM